MDIRVDLFSKRKTAKIYEKISNVFQNESLITQNKFRSSSFRRVQCLLMFLSTDDSDIWIHYTILHICCEYIYTQ